MILKDEIKIPKSLQANLSNKFTQASGNAFSAKKVDNTFWKERLKGVDGTKQNWNLLKQCFPALNFPIKEGIGGADSYKSGVLKGDFNIDSENCLQLHNEEQIAFGIYESFAGVVLVLTIPDEQDFVKIIQALLYKNAPVSLPTSMGAALINGINNWGKIKALRKKWAQTNTADTWAEEFKNKILPYPELYKDKIVVLSKKPYSNISANNLGLEEKKWLELSHRIRLAHECTHQYTLQKYGIASNNLHDELIADYVGIVLANGAFEEEWMLTFLGLENFPHYREGARFQNYIGEIAVNSKDFKVLAEIIKKAIKNIALMDKKLNVLLNSLEIRIRIQTLCETDIIQMASTKGEHILMTKYEELFHII